jgi:hypothetical protein
MMEALRSFRASVLTRATRRNVPEDGFLHSYSLENLKSYTIEDEISYEINHDNGITIVNFYTSKTLSDKSALYPHRISQEIKRDRD